jgi:flagellar biosynthesis anti-sigma factor FlgM
MKIDDISQKLGQIGNLETYTKKQAEEENKVPKGPENKPQPDAKVDLSSTSVEYSKAAEKMDEVPEERAKKIEALKAQVMNDTYHVDSKNIAEKILDDTLFNIVEP